MEGIVVVSAMPDCLKHETGNGHRRLQTNQRRPTSAPGARARGQVAERSGDRGDVVGLGYEPQGALEVRHADVVEEVKPAERFQTAREFREALAPHLGTGGSELASLIHHLFADDFRAEESRFRAAGSTTVPPSPSDAPSIRRT